MEKEKVSSRWLSKQFQTTPRPIQRDLLFLKESGFLLHEFQKGNYQMSKDLVKNLEVFDDTELALVVALKNIVGQLGQPFQKAADGVLDRLYDCVTTMPVFVKIDDAVPLDSALLNRIVNQDVDLLRGARPGHLLDVPESRAVEVVVPGHVNHERPFCLDGRPIFCHAARVGS